MAFPNPDTIPSPALLFDREAISRNLRAMLTIADDRPELLRPHIKTHKCSAIVREQLSLGITRVKCATLAEAEMAAEAGVADILVAYPLVGPNPHRLVELMQRFPETQFSALVDSETTLSAIVTLAEKPVSLFLDLDIGMGRTGIRPGSEAVALVEAMVKNEMIRFAGIHAYDGHNHLADLGERRELFDQSMSLLDSFTEQLRRENIDVPLLIRGGSPTFPLHLEHARQSQIRSEFSPGTVALWDTGYGESHRDLPFEIAACVLTRVISHPGPDRLCLDLGLKAIAAENPLERRVVIPELGDCTYRSQSEEHLVVELRSLARDHFPIGTALQAFPRHICPTVALYNRAYVDA
ncbi:MAG: alanine racemase, partial [Verrucomicrobiota bacterium]